MAKKSKENIESNKGDPEDNLANYWKQKITTHLVIMTGNLGLLFIFVGICAFSFFNERLYVFIFGLICLLQVTNGVLHFMFWAKQNSTIILAMSLINLAWIVAAIVLELVYRLWLTNSFFDDDIVFQLSLLFYLLVAIALAVFYYLVNQTLVKGEPTSPNQIKAKSSDDQNKKKHNKDHK